MVSDRLKEIIFKKLYKDLSCVEIIPYKGELWFIDRENKCWYFIFCSDGTLWWKYGFFKTFFELFSLTDKEFTPVISSWVEEVLNCRVNTTPTGNGVLPSEVEEVLNCRVNTTEEEVYSMPLMVEQVLNHKVNTTIKWMGHPTINVNEVLRGNDITQ